MIKNINDKILKTRGRSRPTNYYLCSCDQCNENIYRRKQRILLKHFCCKNCETLWKQSNWPRGEKHKDYKPEAHIIFYCLYCNNGFEKQRSVKKNFCSSNCRNKYFVGEKAKNWQGGITPIQVKIRNSQEYLEWRKSVFEREKYICQICGQYGGKLHAHHIVPFSIDENKRLDTNNGITLCIKCHKIKHKNFRENGVWVSKVNE